LKMAMADLRGPLVFGDPAQIEARKYVETVEEVVAALWVCPHEQCAECEGRGACLECGHECEECGGTGMDYECDCLEGIDTWLVADARLVFKERKGKSGGANARPN